jgi:phage baseplate assembly protein W
VTDVPHFDLPFRMHGSSFMAVEQDSLRDIQNCAEAVLRTHPGERETVPDFGIGDLTFLQLPIDPHTVAAQIQRFEPRASVLAEEDPSSIEQMMERIKLSISTRDTQESV